MTNTILFLIDTWSSVAGGIQTVNRELCLAVASCCKEPEGQQIKVVCICKDCSEKEQEEAGKGDVALLKADIVEISSRGDDRILEMLFHSSLMATTSVICVVGHAKFTGLAARNVRNKYFPKAKVITTYQMDVDETEGFKEEFEAVSAAGFPDFISKWENRVKIEHEIASGADTVLAVGPRLERSIKSVLTGKRDPQPIVQPLLCGIRENAKVRENSPENPTFVFVGRVEHPKVKGVDLFARAAGELVRRWSLYWRGYIECREPKFVIRGFRSNGVKAKVLFDELKAQAESRAGRGVFITPRPYSTDESSLVADILSASAVVMPSRAEGFGLVALEAISYGVPVVVAKDSGVAELLEKYCCDPFAEPRYIVDTRGKGDKSVERLADALAHFMLTSRYGELLATHLRKTLLEVCAWTAAGRFFLEKVVGLAAPGLPHLEQEEVKEVVELLHKEAGYVDDECRRTSGRPIEDIFVDRSFEEWQPPVMEESVGEEETVEATPQQTSSKGISQKWPDVVKSLGAAIILGNPGSGKTLSLLKEVRQRCLSATASLETSTISLDEITFAVYFHASELARKVIGTDSSVIERVVDLLCERHSPISYGCRAWLRHKFEKGQVLLVVDALDEVPRRGEELDIDPKRILDERLSALQHRTIPCSVLLSSRLTGYTSSSVPGAMQWKLLPFSSGQLGLAARKWLAGHPEAIKTFSAMVRATPPLAELLTNPLLVTLACQIWVAALEENKPLPTFSRRCDLYQQYVTRFRTRWIERMTLKGQKPTLSEEEAFLPFVEEVAWELWHRNPRRSVFTGSEVSKVINDLPKPYALQGRTDLFEDICDSGIMTRSGPREIDAPYLFLHRTLLEFLAGSYVARKSKDPLVRLDPVHEVRDYFTNPGAHTMLWMLVGKLKNPALLLREIVVWAEQQLELPRENSPTQGSPVLAELLVDCLFECDGSTLDRETLERSWELITRGLDRKQRVRRQHGGEWAALVDWSLIYRAMKAVEIHQGPTSHAGEILELIEEIRRTPLRKGGLLPKGAVKDVDKRLNAGLQSGCPLVRWAAIWATAALAAKEQANIRPSFGPLVREKLKQDPSPHVRCVAARALVEMDHPDAIAPLESALDGDCRFTAVGAAIGLGRLGTAEAISRLKAKAKSLLEKPADSLRDSLPLAVIGSLEALVNKALKSDDANALKRLLNDEDLANIFLQALGRSLPRIRGTAASGLGKMGWKSAWYRLKELVETPDDEALDTRSMRGSACYACDQLAAVIEEPKLEEADKLFRQLLSERGEALEVRRPAAAGIVRLLKRGWRSAGLTNQLLQAAEDPDIIIARFSIIALLQLEAAEIIEDAILLLRTFNLRQKKLLCYAVRGEGTITGVFLVRWLLANDKSVDLLPSVLDAIGEAYKKVREKKSLHLRKDLGDFEFLYYLARRSIDLSYHEDARVVASSLKVLVELTQLRAFQQGRPLFQYRGEWLSRARALLDHLDPRVQASACGAFGVLGTREDLARLETLVELSPLPWVKKSAQRARTYLNQQLSES